MPRYGWVRRSDWLLTFVVAVVLLGGSVYIVVHGLYAVKEITVAVIGAAASIVTVVTKFGADAAQAREQVLLTEKRRNYQKLLTTIGGFVRDRQDGLDPLTVAHIESWVFGDTDVVVATNRFVKNTTHDNLRDLLVAMRRSIGLRPLDLCSYDISVVFPTVVKKGLDSNS